MLTGSRRRGGIRRRITALFVPLCVIFLGISAAGFLLTAIHQMRIAEAGSSGTAELAAQFSEELLVEQGIQAAGQYADAKAESIHTQMRTWLTILDSLCDSTAALYSQGAQSSGMTLPHVVEAAARGEVLTMHYGLSPGVREDAALEKELSFYAGLAPVWLATMEHAEQIGSLYMTTPSGINIGCDANAPGKLGFVTYEARGNAWYLSARDSGGLYVSDAYWDSFGRGLTMTLSVPVYAGDSFLGVLGMDILIESINQDILQTQITGNGFALLAAWDGTVISPPEYANQSMTDLLAEQGGALPGGDVLAARFAGAGAYVVQREIDAVHWCLYLILPTADIVAPAKQAVLGIEEIARDTRSSMAAQLAGSVAGALVLFAVLVLAAAGAARHVAGRLADPIVRLCRDVEEIGEGNLSYSCTLRTGDEIEQLGRAFQAMTEKLSQHIKQLAEVTADRERIAAELNVATRIQTGMLPCIFPAFPHREEFDLYATMRPAREVGGDFYDFFLVGQDQLAMVIGDVSGKGVPAALFMVIAKTLIKNQCQMGLEPARVLEEVNRQLCENNDAGLFVTVFLCVLDIPTGRLTWANGGHNLPLVRSGGEWAYLETEPGFVLAGMEDMAYRQESIRLQRGDMLLLYTDGVTESQDAEGELFSEQRLLTTLQETEPNESVRHKVAEVVDTALRFGGEAQADDVTLLAIRYNTSDDNKEEIMGSSGSKVEVPFYESLPPGFGGICYDFAINAALIAQNPKANLYKFVKKGDNCDLVNFSNYQQLKADGILSNQYPDGATSYDSFLGGFQKGDVVIWVWGTNDSNRLGCESHFAVHTGVGTLFFGYNNGDRIPLECYEDTLFHIPHPEQHILYQLPNNKVKDFADRFNRETYSCDGERIG